MSSKKTLGIFMLAMINIAAICNISNLPFTAIHGLASLFYFFFAAVAFFIPVALVSAELATGWPKQGGVYAWVKEALGDRAGFVAIWLQWIENVIWFPATLSFIAATLAYIFYPDLAQNKFYIMGSVLVIFWSVTLLNFFGMKISGWISTICVTIGTILPGILIITLTGLWLINKEPSQIQFTWKSLFPNFSSIQEFSILAAVLLGFGGLEMSAVHAKDVENPQKDYPKAIFLSTIIILVLLTLGSLAIAIVVPKEQIELASGTIEAFRHFFNTFNIAWAIPIIAGLMVIGALGLLFTWTLGPTKGLLATARHGELPQFLQKTNKKEVPTRILLVQALIVTTVSLIVFSYSPTVSSSYRMLFYLSAQLYLIMYILLFISGIVLRYKEPNTPRTFKVPFGNTGMWTVSAIGILGSFFAILMSFFPTEKEAAKNISFFVVFLIIGIIVFCAIPLIIHQCKKPHWHTHKKE